MKDWIPYIGQDVVCLVDGYNTPKGKLCKVKAVRKHCCCHLVDIGLISPIDFSGTCKHHGTLLTVKAGEILWTESQCYAPVERTKTQYVIKEVEVAPAIREMEVQLS